jgi:hypothetical protein
MSTVYPQVLSGLGLVVVSKMMGLLGSNTSIDADTSANAVRLLCYLVWLMSLGSLGSIAFISVNALAIQSDATFDISNARFVFLRILIGALFALMIALPLSLQDFVQFCDFIRSSALAGHHIGVEPKQIETTSSVVTATQIAMLLLPFVLGFSTSLVLMILNRMVGAVQSLLGITTGQK